jgi:hypothetical protein
MLTEHTITFAYRRQRPSGRISDHQGVFVCPPSGWHPLGGRPNVSEIVVCHSTVDRPCKVARERNSLNFVAPSGQTTASATRANGFQTVPGPRPYAVAAKRHGSRRETSPTAGSKWSEFSAKNSGLRANSRPGPVHSGNRAAKLDSAASLSCQTAGQ